MTAAAFTAVTGTVFVIAVLEGAGAPLVTLLAFVYPIARMYADARVLRIYGGSNEIQRELVGRSL